LEECLKYALLLNFEEEPKYDYMIEEFKKAYYLCATEAGLKMNPQAFKLPVFDWNVTISSVLIALGITCYKISARIDRLR
jgi:hypothetical protein